MLQPKGQSVISRRGWIGRIARAFLAFSALLAGRPSRLRSSPGQGGEESGLSHFRLDPWDDRFEFVVTFQFGDERTGSGLRRPYLAVYMEDPQGRLVRTIVLWAQENESWVRSLTRWYRADRERRGRTDLPATLTGATRPPGRYTVVWDGRDDDGELVEQGEYALVMESVRQSSRAFFLRIPIEFGTTPFSRDLDPFGSFSEVHVEFRERP